MNVTSRDNAIIFGKDLATQAFDLVQLLRSNCSDEVLETKAQSLLSTASLLVMTVSRGMAGAEAQAGVVTDAHQSSSLQEATPSAIPHDFISTQILPTAVVSNTQRIESQAAPLPKVADPPPPNSRGSGTPDFDNLVNVLIKGLGKTAVMVEDATSDCHFLHDFQLALITIRNALQIAVDHLPATSKKMVLSAAQSFISAASALITSIECSTEGYATHADTRHNHLSHVNALLLDRVPLTKQNELLCAVDTMRTQWMTAYRDLVAALREAAALRRALLLAEP